MSSFWGEIDALGSADGVQTTAEDPDLDTSIDVVSRLARGFQADVRRLKQDNESQQNELTQLRADVVQFERRAIRAEERVDVLEGDVAELEDLRQRVDILQRRLARASAALDLSLPEPPKPPEAPLVRLDAAR